MKLSRAMDDFAPSMSESMASNVAGPSRRSETRFPLDTLAAAIRQSPRAKDGPPSEKRDASAGDRRTTVWRAGAGLVTLNRGYRLRARLHAVDGRSGVGGGYYIACSRSISQANAPSLLGLRTTPASGSPSRSRWP